MKIYDTEVFPKLSIDLDTSADLSNKVDTFIDWYFSNMVKGQYTDIEKFQKSNNMRNFIEKMAVWYELRFPNYEIKRLMENSNQEKQIKNTDEKNLDCSELYNTKMFIKSLSDEEKKYLNEPCYYNIKNGATRLKLTSTGFVQKSEMLGSLCGWLNDEDRKKIDNDFEGKHIEDVLKFLNERASNIETYTSLKEIIDNYNKQSYQKNEMLNCVMYRIIERGGTRFGPRRAFLFAKEFGRNIDIPMMYGIDYSDPYLKNFISDYIKARGSIKLQCYLNYFERTSRWSKLDTVSIDEVINKYSNDETSDYIPEDSKILKLQK